MDNQISGENTRNFPMCRICPHNCVLQENKKGLCGIRENQDGKIVPLNYGIISSYAIDPVEKKPLRRFFPGMSIMSVGGFGCNLRCPFCQNYHIALQTKQDGNYVLPSEVAEAAKKIPNNIGVAYTYNEPLINYEFIIDCAKEIKKAGLVNVLVTNGYIAKEALEPLLPLIDAANIDLKSFDDKFYKKIGGSLQPVLDTIKTASSHWHIEVTTLIIPGENEDIEPLAQWLADIDPNIPLHISRFFPAYKYSGKQATPPETIYRLCDIASKYLKYVYAGNI